jgi:glutamate-1-semialdehyde aminotransferase
MPNGVRPNGEYPVIRNSEALYQRARVRIPSVTQTLAKGPTQYVNGVAPKYLERGRGCRVWDVDGNEYLDFNMGIGPISLGYCYPRVDAAIVAQLERGITFSLMHPLEVEVAELICGVVPNAEAVRYSKTGCDVTSAAIRLARAFTGRARILACGYHGWHDWTIGTTDRNRGIPAEVRALTSTFSYNDIDSLATQLDDQTAAVILEPMLFEFPRDDFLLKVRELCNAKGALLIFDEMWTGFRLALGGAQQHFGVRADLATFSKAIANGMPLAVLVGRAEIMSLLEKDVFFYTTFGGEALSLAAARATVLELQEKAVPAALQKLGSRLIEGFNGLCDRFAIDYARCVGMGARSLVTFAPGAGSPLEAKSLVQQELLKRGILWQGMHALSYSHMESDIDYTLSAYGEVLPLLKRAIAEGNIRRYLHGEPVQPVFRTVTGKR